VLCICGAQLRRREGARRRTVGCCMITQADGAWGFEMAQFSWSAKTSRGEREERGEFERGCAGARVVGVNRFFLSVCVNNARVGRRSR
jgi:hypothetical protein